MSGRIFLTTISILLALVLSETTLAQQSAPGGGRGMGGGSAGGGLGQAPAVSGPRVQIGIAMDRVPDALAAHVNVEQDAAVLIVNVFEDGAAEAAGVKRFDIVTHVNGQSPVTQELIRRTLRTKEPGDEVTLRVLRGGEAHDITITLEEAQPHGVGGGFALRFSPEQLQLMPQGNVYAPPEMIDQTGMIRMTPEQQRNWRQQFQRQWSEHHPEVEEHLRRLRQELDALRETLASEWREHVREFRIDDETREKIHQLRETAADRIAEVINRTLEAVDVVDIEIDVQTPRVQILRDGRERGMIVQQDFDQRQRLMEQERRTGREDIQRQRAEILERRLAGLEDRLERIERMMRRMLRDE